MQGELFTLAPPPRMAAKPTAPRCVRYRPASRVMCDLCIRAIHALGVAAAPFPRSARWRLGDLRLCEAHKQEAETPTYPRSDSN